MSTKTKEQIDKITHLLTMQPASTLLSSGTEEWSPSDGFGAVVKDNGPIAFRLEIPHSIGEERLLTSWLHHWKEFHPHFFPIGNTTPLEHLFDLYSRCNSMQSQGNCIGVALQLPWSDPSLRYKRPLTMDAIDQRKLLARFNFPALLGIVQQYCEICRRGIDEQKGGAEAYNLVGEIEAFSKDAFSVLAEDARKTLEDLWSRYAETTQNQEIGVTLMQTNAWDDMRTALYYQYLGISKLLEAVWRFGKQDKILDFIVSTGQLIMDILSEELSNSVSRPKGEIPMRWDAKALLWQTICAKLKTTPLVIGGGDPGVSDVVFGLFAASGTISMHYGSRRHASMVRRWSMLLSVWNYLVRKKGISEMAKWYQTIREHPKGDLAKDFILLYNLQILFNSSLEDLSHYDFNLIRMKQRGKGKIPEQLLELFPPFMFNDVDEPVPFEISSSVKSLIID